MREDDTGREAPEIGAGMVFKNAVPKRIASQTVTRVGNTGPFLKNREHAHFGQKNRVGAGNIPVE